ncbi:MAG TPA: phosphotransferase [Burkholderiaceae bacterium]|nr:phosphotransferase [Burkholderiaceae bacterium]
MTSFPPPIPGEPSATPHSAARVSGAGIEWADPARQRAFDTWLNEQSSAHHLLPATARAASADASFRRYFRVDRADGGSCIVMDAPPAQENCQPFVKVARLMAACGLHVPDILAWDEPQGFMLLSDLGSQTLLDVLDTEHPQANLPRYKDALAALTTWQTASQTDVLPPYDEAVLRRELQLFPDWYLTRHKGLTLSEAQLTMLDKTFATIVTRNLAGPKVYVHRDFMPRNLMVPHAGHVPAGAAQRLGVLDFQDALYGPVTYDIASLMRDAFLSWEEDFVLEVTIRYWEQARKLGLLDFEGWSEDFGEFYRAVEWMGLQRHLKVLGIFARLTLRDGKPKYLADTPRFVMYVRNTASRYRELTPLLRLIDEVEGLQAATGFAYGRV